MLLLLRYLLLPAPLLLLLLLQQVLLLLLLCATSLKLGRRLLLEKTSLSLTHTFGKLYQTAAVYQTKAVALFKVNRIKPYFSGGGCWREKLQQ